MKNRSNCNDDIAKLRHTALNLLARREHSVLELRHKLTRRGFADPAIETVLAELLARDLLNESRYAEIYAHSRIDKGYGPLRIERELRERGVPEDIVAVSLAALDDCWEPKLTQVYRKRFGTAAPSDLAEQARQTRFLRQRGFTLDQINRLFREFDSRFDPLTQTHDQQR